MATLLSDFGRFIVAVLKRWQAYITGSLITAIVFMYEHVSEKMISATNVIWGATGFFIAGTFLAWREQYRSDRPIEIRDRLDAFVRRGEALYDKWKIDKKRPKLRTKQWLSATRSFVKRHFSISQFDAFNNHPMEMGDVEAVRRRISTYFDFSGRSETDHSLALKIVVRIDALKELRDKITD